MAVNILHNIERDVDSTARSDLCYSKPSTFIERYCSKLNMPQGAVLLAKFVSEKLEQNNLITDNTPQSIAAGVIYFISQVCNLNISKTDIKNICKVSEVTVNKCYKKMDAIKCQLVPSHILATLPN
jgi:transcription initiation factor TFIIB